MWLGVLRLPVRVQGQGVGCRHLIVELCRRCGVGFDHLSAAVGSPGTEVDVLGHLYPKYTEHGRRGGPWTAQAGGRIARWRVESALLPELTSRCIALPLSHVWDK